MPFFVKLFKKHTKKLHVFGNKDKEKRTINILELIIVVIPPKKGVVC